MRMRDRAYAHHAAELTALCDDATFTATFGAPPSQLESLLASKTATLPLLLHIAPAGTPDPTPLLYNGAFYALDTTAALACTCNLAAVAMMARPYNAVVGARKS